MSKAKTTAPEQKAEIIDRGRGPEIAGTRITVYDVMDYYREGWHHARIAALFRLSSKQILAAIDYIEKNKGEVQKDYQEILDRCARGNSPEIRAKQKASHAKLQKVLGELRRNGQKKPSR